MRIPRFMVAAALVVAAMAIPAAAPPLDPLPSGMVGMGHEGYEIKGVHDARLGADGVPVIRIHRGDRLSFQNDSRWVHIIGPGSRGLLTDPGHGAMAALKMLEENDVYTTPPWTTAGTFLLTCTVHPEMNAKVVVLP
ncbi:cupredoxin domain-containing protein [Cellulomonas sp. URHB0016]